MSNCCILADMPSQEQVTICDLDLGCEFMNLAAASSLVSIYASWSVMHTCETRV